MHQRVSGGRRSMIVSSVSLILSSFVFGTSAQADPPGKSPRSAATASPIKHVIIIVGENRSFDHIFATYKPTRHSEKVLNLLSQRIVKDDGTPGPNFAKAHQFQLTSAPNAGKYFIGADLNSKVLYTTLPPPDIGGVPAGLPPPVLSRLPAGGPGLPA